MKLWAELANPFANHHRIYINKQPVYSLPTYATTQIMYTCYVFFSLSFSLFVSSLRLLCLFWWCCCCFCFCLLLFATLLLPLLFPYIKLDLLRGWRQTSFSFSLVVLIFALTRFLTPCLRSMHIKAIRREEKWQAIKQKQSAKVLSFFLAGCVPNSVYRCVLTQKSRMQNKEPARHFWLVLVFRFSFSLCLLFWIFHFTVGVSSAFAFAVMLFYRLLATISHSLALTLDSSLLIHSLTHSFWLRCRVCMVYVSVQCTYIYIYATAAMPLLLLLLLFSPKMCCNADNLFR